MNQNEKTVRDGVMLVASYHFLLAILSLVGVIAILVFSIIPAFNGTGVESSVFLPVVGMLIGAFLAAFYGITGAGLISLKNSARMTAVFLALFGTIGGLFILVGAGIPAINSLLPDMAAVAGVIIGGLCGYFLLTILDLAVLVFLFNRRVRFLFYGEPYLPDPAEKSLSSRFRSAFGEEQVSEPKREPEPEPEPVVRRAPQRVQQKKEAPVVRRQSPPEVLDTPGDLFTEPVSPKK